MTSPAAGWYSDPGGSGGQRYWSGTAWTDQVTPVVGQEGPVPGSGDSQWPPLSPPKPATGPGSRAEGSGADSWPRESASAEVPTAQSPQHPPGYGSPSGSVEPTGGALPAPEVSYQVRTDPRMKFGPDGQVLAGWWRRLGGYLLDGVAIGIVTALVLAVFGALSGAFSEVVNVSALEELLDKIERNAAEQQSYQPTPEELTAVIGPGFMTLVIIGWLVSAILGILNGVVLVARSGQTIGDRVAQTRKVVAGRRPPTIGIAFVRWLIPMALMMASNIPFLGVAAYAAWLVDYLRPLWDAKRQTWHDKATSTYVERADLAGPLAK